MHALEVQRRFMFVSVADGAERVVGLERNPPERVGCKHDGTIGKMAPSAVVLIVQLRCMIENQTHAFEGDEAIRELVLDCLEPSDRLPELMPLSGVVRRQ